jgi:hypothetical protein
MQESQIMLKIKVYNSRLKTKSKKIKLKRLTHHFFLLQCNQDDNHSGSWVLWSFFLINPLPFNLPTLLHYLMLSLHIMTFNLHNILYSKSHHCSTRLHQHYICKIHQWNTNLFIYLRTSMSKYLNCDIHG